MSDQQWMHVTWDDTNWPRCRYCGEQLGGLSTDLHHDCTKWSFRGSAAKLMPPCPLCGGSLSMSWHIHCPCNDVYGYANWCRWCATVEAEKAAIIQNQKRMDEADIAERTRTEAKCPYCRGTPRCRVIEDRPDPDTLDGTAIFWVCCGRTWPVSLDEMAAWCSVYQPPPIEVSREVTGEQEQNTQRCRCGIRLPSLPSASRLKSGRHVCSRCGTVYTWEDGWPRWAPQ